MNYITVEDYKLYNNITTLTAWETTRIEFFIDLTKWMLDNLIGDLTEHSISEKIYFCDISENNEFFIKWFNISSIDKINWTDYSWVLGEDYFIDGRKVMISNFEDFIFEKTYNFLELEYTSWFATIPSDIKLLQLLLVNGELNKQNWQEVETYKIGDFSITYAKNWLTDPKNILNKYKTINI
jgi:hypothetical protein